MGAGSKHSGTPSSGEKLKGWLVLPELFDSLNGIICSLTGARETGEKAVLP